MPNLKRIVFSLVAILLVACSDAPSTPALESTTVTATPVAIPQTPTAAPIPPTVAASPATTVPAAPATAAPSPPGVVTLNAVGDLMLARDIITLMDENGSAYPFAAVRPILADADITIANMEGTFTDRGEQATKFYTFRTPPRHARGLAEASIDIVSLGNNHTMDFGATGLADTLAALDAAGVRHSGAGPDAQSARRPAIIEVKGLRLAFLSYNAAALSESSPAGPSSPGPALGDEASIRADVAQAKASADIVIVSLHAGTEYVDPPNATQRQLLQAAADAGAALVLGHHAHVVQGWQRYGSSVIVYGLGNFVFDLDSQDYATLGPRPFQTLVLHFEITRDGVQRIEARPVFIDPAQNRPVIPTGDTLLQIQERLERLNAGL